MPFFESQGMRCPPRKADSDFLQEVTSRKDQQCSCCHGSRCAMVCIVVLHIAKAPTYVSCNSTFACNSVSAGSPLALQPLGRPWAEADLRYAECAVVTASQSAKPKNMLC